MSELSTNELQALRRKCVVGGGILLIVCLVGAIFDVRAFCRAYLIAFVFWIGVTLGCLGMLMMQHLTGGRWALVIRRILEAATRTLPLMALAAIPVLASVRVLYPWAQPAQMDATILAKRAYLNVPFFVVRMIFYFVCWFLLTHYLNRWSREEDREGSISLWGRIEALSGGGIVLLGFTLHFASVDWLMSLEPHWYSTVYGLIFMMEMALAGTAVAIIAFLWLSQSEPLANVASPLYLQDLGSILMMWIIIWAYLEFSQFLIIWGEDIADEIPWYLRRLHDGWGSIGLGLVLLGFAMPFMMLLFRHIKRHPKYLVSVALLILFMRVIDLCWMVLPAFGSGELSWELLAMVVLLPLGMGGLWVGYFIRELQQLPLLPVNDPRMKGVAQHAAELG